MKKGESRETYIEKEKDKESQLADHGVRKYDYGLGRFTSPDVLWEVTKGWSPYMYSFNNPIGFMDGNGYLPGDAFTSEAQAAHDFAKNYNPVSMAYDLEVSTSIYKYINTKGKDAYTYAVPNMVGVRSANSTYSEISSDDYEKVATAHTHGPMRSRAKKLNPEKFSDKDINTCKDFKLPGYLVTYTGLVNMYNPFTGKVTNIFKNLPGEKEYPSGNRSNLLEKLPEERPVPIKIWENGMPERDAKTLELLDN